MAHATGGSKSVSVDPADYQGTLLRSNPFNGGSTAQFNSAPASNAIVWALSTDTADQFPTSGAFNDGFGQDLVKGDEVWFQVKSFMPTGFDYLSDNGVADSNPGGRIKFMRILTQPADESATPHIDFYISYNVAGPDRFEFIYEGGSKGFQDISGGTSLPVLNTWETYQMYVKFDNVSQDSGGEGRVLFWKEDTLIGEITNEPTLPAADGKATIARFMPLWNGNPPANQTNYIDDYIITSTRPQFQDAAGNYKIPA